jgi:hypothetical protein
MKLMILKNKFFEFFVLLVIWALFYFGIRFVLLKLNIQFGPFLGGTAITMLFISFTYKKLWSVKTVKSLSGLFILIFSIILLFSTSSYFISLHQRSLKLYSYFTSENKRGWKGEVYQPDDKLGFKPFPNSKGFMTFSIGDDLPVAFDNDGFRIPLSDTVKTNEETNKNLLFLGCSFTFGDACLAEETFPFIVAKEFNMTYANAGVCSYGLSQMVLLAQELIPKYKPKFVIVQHSPWLIERGLNLFAPVYFGSMPSPYFAEREGEVEIHPPLYRTQIFNLDSETIKKESEIIFFIRKGLFFNLKEDWLKLSTKIKLLIGKYNRPVNNYPEAEKYAYTRIHDIAEQYHSKLIILTLYNPSGSSQLKELFSKQNVLFANADSLLDENLSKSKSKIFIMEYAHWRMNNSDSILVDGHPNPLAHQLISKSIIPLIRETK